MKIKLFILLVFLSFNCSGQYKFPLDKDFEGLNGFPKKIIETAEVEESNKIVKEVFHFDKSGYLIKVEHYNWHDLDKDTLYLGDITIYKKLSLDSKIAFTLNKQTKDTVRIKKYKIINDSIIDINIKEYNNSFKTEITQKLDKNNRIIKTISKVSDTITQTQKANSRTEFIYDSELKKLIIKNDRTGEKAKTLVVVNVREDEFENYVYRELIDENNQIIYRIKREYIYH